MKTKDEQSIVMKKIIQILDLVRDKNVSLKTRIRRGLIIGAVLHLPLILVAIFIMNIKFYYIIFGSATVCVLLSFLFKSPRVKKKE